MKILVTGSSGTIGTRLCEKLLAAGHDVVGADWEKCKWIDAVEKIRVDIDLRNESAFKKLPKDIEMIVHLGANARVYELVEHPDRARDNFLTTFNVLEFARQNQITKFIFASSREAYGNANKEEYTEDMARIENCESPYTASKIGGEALVWSYMRCYGVDAVIFRFSNVYGMYDDSVRVVPQFVRKARAGETLLVYGEKKCLDFTYIDDVVDGITASIDRFDAAKNDVYNLAYGDGTTLMYVATAIKELTNSSSKIEVGESRTGEFINYVANVDKAEKVLGFDPKYSFDQGIKKTVEWYLQNT